MEGRGVLMTVTRLLTIIGLAAWLVYLFENFDVLIIEPKENRRDDGDSDYDVGQNPMPGNEPPTAIVTTANRVGAPAPRNKGKSVCP